MKEDKLTDMFFGSETKEPIIITDNASQQFQKILKEEVPENHYIRIGVKGGGCSGLSYVLDIDEKTEYDELYEMNNVTYILDKRHKLYVEGMTIDFSDGLDNRGFTFENPNADKTCGCGTSFST
ncbi:MAG TPA: iron-sulfur cluster assembly accessory protein [Balneolales bacterium]|nr:iron-sulfur cluster assembly accessory protein [Balneolales bacterium]